jgi:hypothetical protein
MSILRIGQGDEPRNPICQLSNVNLNTILLRCKHLKMNGTSRGERLPSRLAHGPHWLLTDFFSMLRLLLCIISSGLAVFTMIYELLWLVCYISDHDSLGMLHMYSSSVVLSVVFGIILSLNMRKIPALIGALRRKAPIS